MGMLLLLPIYDTTSSDAPAPSLPSFQITHDAIVHVIQNGITRKCHNKVSRIKTLFQNYIDITISRVTFRYNAPIEKVSFQIQNYKFPPLSQARFLSIQLCNNTLAMMARNYE